MRKSSILFQKKLLTVGLFSAVILASAPVLAVQDPAVFPLSGGDLSLSSGAGLKIPLSEYLSLDLKLSSVPTTPSTMGDREFGIPPIPFSKPPGSDLHYTRLGVGFSFRF